MSLQISDGKRSNLPKNAVVLSEDDALDFQWRKINTWPVKSEVWAFKYGVGSLVTTAGLTALYIGRHYRRKLKLHGYGYLSTLFSTMVSTGLAAGLLHLEFISSKVLLYKTPCPVCLQTRASLLQTTSAVLYPLIVSPVICSLVAVKVGVRIPYYTEGRELWKMWSGFTKPIIRPILLLLAFHGLLAAGVTYLQGQQLYKVEEKYLTYERNHVNMNYSFVH